MKIEVGFWKTRSGRKARVICTDAHGKYPIRGYVIDEEDCMSPGYGWIIDGRISNTEHYNDLIEPWVEPKRKIKLAPALLKDSSRDRYITSGWLYESEEDARYWHMSDFIRWPAAPELVIELEVEE